MTAKLFVTLDCDAPDCMEAHDSGTTSIDNARIDAASIGWRAVWHTLDTPVEGLHFVTWLDYCPEHVAAMTSKAVTFTIDVSD